MKKMSAGILLYRQTSGMPEVFLVHPGGPFWAKKDDGAWTIPKGEYTDDEAPLAAAKREFFEETGIVIDGDFWELGVHKQPSGKLITAFALEGNCDAAAVRSNLFTLEWPRKSGRMAEFPEVDRAAWFSLDQAGRKIIKGQLPILGVFSKRLGFAGFS